MKFLQRLFTGLYFLLEQILVNKLFFNKLAAWIEVSSYEINVIDFCSRPINGFFLHPVLPFPFAPLCQKLVSKIYEKNRPV
jgi:hypothetical protein